MKKIISFALLLMFCMTLPSYAAAIPEPINYKITVLLQDENDHTALSGGTFSVYDDKGTIINNITTNENGIAEIDLPVGIYKIAQKNVPFAYKQLTPPQSITLKKDSILIFDNYKENAQIIHLVGGKSNIQGAIVEIYDKNYVQINSKLTNENGRVTFYLKENTYFAKVHLPAGYTPLNDFIPFTIKSKTNRVITIPVKEKSAFVLTTVDEVTKEPISNIKYQIYDKNRKKLAEQFTDRYGKIIYQGTSPEDVYYIKEQSVPEKYTLNHDFIKIKGNEHFQITKMPDEKTLTIMTKTDEKNTVTGQEVNTGIPNMTFGIRMSNSKKLIKTVKTDGNGIAEVNLPIGEYLIYPVYTPKTFTADDPIKKHNVTKTGTNKVFFHVRPISIELVTKLESPTATYVGELKTYKISANNQGKDNLQKTNLYFLTNYENETIQKLILPRFNKKMEYQIFAMINDKKVLLKSAVSSKTEEIDIAAYTKGNALVDGFVFEFPVFPKGFIMLNEMVIKTKPNLLPHNETYYAKLAIKGYVHNTGFEKKEIIRSIVHNAPLMPKTR